MAATLPLDRIYSIFLFFMRFKFYTNIQIVVLCHKKSPDRDPGKRSDFQQLLPKNFPTF
jgi:hypothetical protein